MGTFGDALVPIGPILTRMVESVVGVRRRNPSQLVTPKHGKDKGHSFLEGLGYLLRGS